MTEGSPYSYGDMENYSKPDLIKNPTELTKLDSEIRDEFEITTSA